MADLIRPEYLVKSVAEFEERFGCPGPLVTNKAASFLSEPMQEFLRLSPFCVVSSQDANGHADTTPRGDPQGFVEILNPKTILIPDRPGNNRHDTFRNILTNSSVSVLFLIPGILNTLRVNGNGFVTRDPNLLSKCAIKNRIPPIGLLIEIEEAFGHCSKAIRRSGLWDQENQIESSAAPSLGDMMSAHLNYSQKILDDMEQRITRDIREFMY